MPKQLDSPHFDVAGLLAAVQQQDVGLIVSTNNSPGFLRLMYQGMRKAPDLRCRIYAAPGSGRKFWLTKAALPSGAELVPDDADNEESPA